MGDRQEVMGDGLEVGGRVAGAYEISVEMLPWIFDGITRNILMNGFYFKRTSSRQD